MTDHLVEGFDPELCKHGRPERVRLWGYDSKTFAVTHALVAVLFDEPRMSVTARACQTPSGVIFDRPMPLDETLPACPECAKRILYNLLRLEP